MHFLQDIVKLFYRVIDSNLDILLVIILIAVRDIINAKSILTFKKCINLQYFQCEFETDVQKAFGLAEGQ